MKYLAILFLTFCSTSAMAGAAVAIGTVKHVQQQGKTNHYGTRTHAVFTFTLSQPINVPGAQYQFFSISGETIDEASDRNAMISIVLTAFASGKELQVSYDDAGAFMDNGMVGVYYISVRP